MIALLFVLLAAPPVAGDAGPFQVARAALASGEWARQARVIPRDVGGRVEGVKLYGIRRRSLPAALGLRNGDVVLRVDGKAIAGPDWLPTHLEQLEGADALTIDIERRGQPLTLHVTLTDEAVVAPAEAEARPAEVTLAGVEALGPGHFRVPAAGLKDVDWPRQARVVPAFQDGEAVGFRLVGMRSTGVLRQLGFENGDVVRSVGGQPLHRPEAAMAIYTWLQTARDVEVEVGRRGKTLTLRYTLDGPDRVDAPPPQVPAPEPEASFDLRGELEGRLALTLGQGPLAEGRLELVLAQARLVPAGAAEPGIALGRVTVGVALSADAEGALARLTLLKAEGGDVRLVVEEGTVRWRASPRARLHLEVVVHFDPASPLAVVAGAVNGTLRLTCSGSLERPRCRPARP